MRFAYSRIYVLHTDDLARRRYDNYAKSKSRVAYRVSRVHRAGLLKLLRVLIQYRPNAILLFSREKLERNQAAVLRET